MSWEKSVFSSMVSSVGYDTDTEELIIVWARSGRQSRYSGVPEGLADQLARAPSVGQMLNSEIKPYFKHRYG